MPSSLKPAALPDYDPRIARLLLGAALLFSLWGVSVGWSNLNLRGMEFRQTQTAISTYFIQQEHNFSLAYPTPVLGKPWSVPMEFPLYQWTVVGLGNATGLTLTAAARLVSVGCFYLTLPAVFLLLGTWNIPTGRRQVMVALMACSPLYIFYTRAFLMETMALMMSVWFLLAYLRWMRTRRRWWLLVAMVFGAGAGLVKVTTFVLYLIVAAIWTCVQWWQARRESPAIDGKRIRSEAARAVLAVAGPLVLILWWVHFSDGRKALNPSSQFLLSSHLTAYHFGTNETRFAARVWAAHWKIISQDMMWLPLLLASGGLMLVSASNWRWKVAFCLACFLGIQVVFPELYAWHDYYYVANTLFLVVAIGLAATALLDTKLPKWVSAIVVGALLAGQGYQYLTQFYPAQSALSPEGSDLTQALQQITNKDDVLVIVGDDWNAMIPYYSHRRALMLRAGVDQDEAQLRQAFAALHGEKVGALVSTGAIAKDSLLLRLAGEYFGIDRLPMLKTQETSIFIADDRADAVFESLQGNPIHEIYWAQGGLIFADPLAGKWYETRKLKRFQLTPFKYMQPQPIRFFSSFGATLSEGADAIRFGAHPLTRLVFAVPPGKRHLTTEVGISPGAYENLSPADATDGIDIRISLIRPNEADLVVFKRYLNPLVNNSDRGAVPVDVAFDVPAGAEVELAVTAGPNDVNRRDWAFLGKIKIE